MDVILDSNIFLSDPAYQGAEFASFFIFLRDSNSRLILPNLVKEEVEGRFRSILAQNISTVIRDWGQVTRLIGRSGTTIPLVNLDEHMAALKQRLENPAPGVTVQSVPIQNLVTVDQVASHGIARRKPADGNGEQLRDVMIWLFALAHARNCDVPVAFVSDDKDFFESKDIRTLHPELRAEIDKEGLPLSFFADLEQFLGANARAWTIVDEEYLRKAGLVAALDFRIERFLESPLGPFSERRIEAPKILSLKLSAGSLHTIDQHVSILNLSYRGEVEGKVASNTIDHSYSHIFGSDPETGSYNVLDIWKVVFQVKVTTKLVDRNLTDISIVFTEPIQYGYGIFTGYPRLRYTQKR